ncbi:MAG: DUF1127 domain-containing protein [Paracoccaceae bacterium]
MTMYIESSRPAPFGAVLIVKIVNFVDATVANLKAWNAARKTENTLRNLSNRQLEDIGMCRADIKFTSLDIATRQSF